MQILLRNSTTSEPEPLEIPGCGRRCAVQRMFELYEPVLPTGEWTEECALPNGTTANNETIEARSSANRMLTACVRGFGWTLVVSLLTVVWSNICRV